MLSLSLLSAKQGMNYFVKENYYLKEEGIEFSEWYGSLAREMHLEGRVTEKEFGHILKGENPATGHPLVKRQEHQEKRARAGLDLTFSAPKSVSLTSLKDERIVEAHQEAVRAALSHVEASYLKARNGGKEKGCAFESTQNLCAAVFHHDCARQTKPGLPPDPQLHSHAVLANMTKLENGKFRALRTESFYENSKLAGTIYQSELAHRLASLGYEIEVQSNGTFEIAGYEREDLERFSKRRMQMEEAGITNQKEARTGVKKDRLAKVREFRREELRDVWLQEAREAGIQIPDPGDTPPISKNEANSAAHKALKESVAHLTERDVRFRGRDLETEALARGFGKFRHKEVKEAFAKSHWIRDTQKTGVYSTDQALERERETELLLKNGKNRHAPICTSEEIQALVKSKGEKSAYSQGQEDALRLSLSSKDRFVAWQGVAGAGKSYALNDLRAMAEKKGMKVRGFAPDASSAMVLGESAGIRDVKTLHSHLGSKNRPSRNPELWVVDEAGKISAPLMLSLMERAQKENARVVLVGDTRQLSSVEAGNPFKNLQQNGIATAQLSEHRRQRNQELKALVEKLSKSIQKEPKERVGSQKTFEVFQAHVERDRTFKLQPNAEVVLASSPHPDLKKGDTYTIAHIRKGESAEIVALRTKDGREVEVSREKLEFFSHSLVERAKETTRHEHLVRDFLALSGKSRSETLILAGTNRERRELVSRVRSGLQAEGTLGSDMSLVRLEQKDLTRTQSHEARFYEKGDLVLFHGRTAGEFVPKVRYEVVAVDPSRQSITLRDPEGNERLHDTRRGEKSVFKKETIAVAEGESLRWRFNHEGRVNGHKVMIAKIDDKEFTLRKESGEEIRVPRDTPLHLDYAWISTAYSSQGMTCDRVLLSTDRTMLREGLYVAASRAKYELRLYTGDLEGLNAQAEKSQAKVTAHEVVSEKNAPRVASAPLKPEASMAQEKPMAPLQKPEPTMQQKTLSPLPKQEPKPQVRHEETVEMEMEI